MTRARSTEMSANNIKTRAQIAIALKVGHTAVPRVREGRVDAHEHPREAHPRNASSPSPLQKEDFIYRSSPIFLRPTTKVAPPHQAFFGIVCAVKRGTWMGDVDGNHWDVCLAVFRSNYGRNSLIRLEFDG